MGKDMKKVNVLGGQVESATGGQFKLKSGGQLHRFFT
jgi:hypothetical protein